MASTRRARRTSRTLVVHFAPAGAPACGRFITAPELLVSSPAAVSCGVCRDTLAGNFSAVINHPAAA